MTTSLRSDPNTFASELFDGLPRRYDQLGNLLSMGQDRRWRRAMIDKVSHGGPERILDVATGPGGVAFDVRRRTGAHVVGIDLSEEMLHQARRNIAQRQVGGVTFAQARAEELPFGDETFDALTVTYLLRYVSDAQATVAELVRVLKTGAVMASMEFAVPTNPTWRAAWWCYTRWVLPVAGWLTGGREWYRVGRFLGPNISGHYRRHSISSTVGYWEAAGMTDVHVQPMSLGGGVVIWGRRPAMAEIHEGPAYYATGDRGPWRDARVLLHLPYTMWNLSYVALGAVVVTRINWTTMWATMLAFFLALGVSAHAFDELKGRPLNTELPSWVLKSAALGGLAGSVALGIVGVALGRVGSGLLIFIAVGAFFVPVYNLELFGGWFHTDLGLAVVWGAMPIMTSAYAQSRSVSLTSVLLAVMGVLLIVAQRSLSTPVRLVRRKVLDIDGEFRMTDGSARPIDRAFLLAPAEKALRAMSWAMMALGAAVLVLRR